MFFCAQNPTVEYPKLRSFGKADSTQPQIEKGGYRN